MTDLDLLGSIDLDFKNNVATIAQIGHGSSVVIAEKFGPLKETIIDAVLFKSIASRKYIRLIMLARALFSGRPRTTEEQSRVPAQQGVHDGALTNSAWTRDDHDQRNCTRR